MRRLLTSVAGMLLVAAIAGGRPVGTQAPAAGSDADVRFEVASVKENKSAQGGARFGTGGQPGGLFTAENAPLRDLIRFALAVQPFQLVGGPDWIGSQRFDITARQPANLPAPLMSLGGPGPLQHMLRNLLVDRFKLKVHRDTRELPIYALVLARADRKLGPNLQPSAGGCAALRRAEPGAPPAEQRPSSNRVQCGIGGGIGSLAAGDMPMEIVANSLATRVGRQVVDHTGLTGTYDFTLEFTPDPTQLPPGSTAPAGEPPLVNGVPMQGPSLFTALQEQLGLKLDSQRGPVDVWVIDSVQHPTED